MSALLTGLVALAPLAVDMFLPSMPAMALSFKSDPATVQLTVTVFLLTYAVSQLGFGPTSDRWGRRPIMLAGLVLFALSGLVCMLAPTINILITGRALQGFASGCGPTLSRAVVRDVYERDRAARVLAYMATAMTLAPILGPIAGGFLEVWLGWRSIFVLLTVLGFLFLAFVWIGLPETNRQRDPLALQPRRMLSNYKILLSSRAYVGYTLVVTFMFGGHFAFITGSAFVLIDVLHVSPDIYGFCFGFVAFGIMTGAFTAGRLMPRLGINRIIAAGTLVGMGGGLLLAALNLWGDPSVVRIVGPMYVFAVGMGMVMPPAMAGAIAPFPQIAGLASAALGFLQMSAAALYGIALGQMYDGTARPMVIAITLAGIGAVVSFFLVAPYRPSPESGGVPSGQTGS